MSRRFVAKASTVPQAQGGKKSETSSLEGESGLSIEETTPGREWKCLLGPVRCVL